MAASKKEKMGQYFYIVNTAKKQYLHPHKLGEGLKLFELGTNCMHALAWLLADNDGGGQWAGDPIVIAGDYGTGMHSTAQDEFEDISFSVVEELCRKHAWFAKEMASDLRNWGQDKELPATLHALLWPGETKVNQP